MKTSSSGYYSLPDFQHHWELSPAGTVDIRITTDPPKCKVALSIPGLDQNALERFPIFINTFAKDTVGTGVITVNR